MFVTRSEAGLTPTHASSSYNEETPPPLRHIYFLWWNEILEGQYNRVVVIDQRITCTETLHEYSTDLIPRMCQTPSLCNTEAGRLRCTRGVGCKFPYLYQGQPLATPGFFCFPFRAPTSDHEQLAGTSLRRRARGISIAQSQTCRVNSNKTSDILKHRCLKFTLINKTAFLKL